MVYDTSFDKREFQYAILSQPLFISKKELSVFMISASIKITSWPKRHQFPPGNPGLELLLRLWPFLLDPLYSDK